jgi:DNA-binding SARP family transcriptional activator
VRRTIQKYRIGPGPEAGETWPWPVRIYTLGRFEVVVGDRPLAFGQKVPRRLIELLKALVALGGRDIPQQRVLELLWPDEEGDGAHHALSVAIHRLRRLLADPQCIRIEDGALSLDRTRVWVDAFQALLSLAAATSAARDARTSTPDALIDAVRVLYRGAFLPGDGDVPWTISMRERLRTAFIDCVAAHGARLEARGAWRDAEEWYGRGIQADDLSEAFYQGLMRCQLQLGRHAEGLSTFRRMRQMLSITLGIQPSAASEALFRAMQAR